MARQRHGISDFEALLREAETQGWRVTRGNGYFKCLCPCADKCFVTVVLTPSSSRTLANTRARFRQLMSQHFEVQLEGQVGIYDPADEAERDALTEAAVDAITEYLVAQPHIIDPIIHASLATGVVKIMLTVFAEDAQHAIAIGNSIVAEAIYKVGIDNRTPFAVDELRRVPLDA